MKRVLLFMPFLLLIFSFGCVSQSSSEVVPDTIYIIYSPSCPHCHTLINYIDSLNLNIDVKKTTNGGDYVNFLKLHGINWDGGVPLTFSLLKNGTLITISGYPSSSQEKDGYFINMEYEKSMCERMGGSAVFINSTYKFCKLPNGMLLGNRYSIGYLINLIKRDLS